jgi:hypothetical protein
MRPKLRRLAEPKRKARQAPAKTTTRIPTPIGRVSAARPATPLSLTSLYFGVLVELGVDEAACEVVAAPEGDPLEAADGAVLAPPPADALAAVVDRLVAEPCFADGAVNSPRFFACDEGVPFDALDVVSREEGLAEVELRVSVAVALVLAAARLRFGAERWTFGAALVVLGAGFVVAVVGLVAAGLAAAGAVVAVLVVVVLVVGVAPAELVVGELDGDPACCCATQVW